MRVSRKIDLMGEFSVEDNAPCRLNTCALAFLLIWFDRAGPKRSRPFSMEDDGGEPAPGNQAPGNRASTDIVRHGDLAVN